MHCKIIHQPGARRRTVSLSLTAWGLPIDTAVTLNSFPQRIKGESTATPFDVAARVVGTLGGSRIGSPMSTVMEPSLFVWCGGK